MLRAGRGRKHWFSTSPVKLRSATARRAGRVVLSVPRDTRQIQARRCSASHGSRSVNHRCGLVSTDSLPCRCCIAQTPLRSSIFPDSTVARYSRSPRSSDPGHHLPICDAYDLVGTTAKASLSTPAAPRGIRFSPGGYPGDPGPARTANQRRAPPNTADLPGCWSPGHHAAPTTPAQSTPNDPARHDSCRRIG